MTLIDPRGRLIGASLRFCRGCGCGCDDNHACPGGCTWVLLDVEDDSCVSSGFCSRCAELAGWHPVILAATNMDVGQSMVVGLMAHLYGIPRGAPG